MDLEGRLILRVATRIVLISATAKALWKRRFCKHRRKFMFFLLFSEANRLFFYLWLPLANGITIFDFFLVSV
jgi:hypothetical protein